MNNKDEINEHKSMKEISKAHSKLLEGCEIENNYSGTSEGTIAKLYGSEAIIKIEPKNFLERTDRIILDISGKKLTCSAALSHIIRKKELFKDPNSIKNYDVMSFPDGRIYATSGLVIDMTKLDSNEIKKHVYKTDNIEERYKDFM